MNANSSLDLYFQDSKSWDADRCASLRRSSAVAWRVASAGWICAVSCACALAVLLPLKRVDPFLVRVDSTTGIVDVVPVYSGDAPIDEAVTRYFLSHYVSVCERFNFPTAESDYEECGAFHTPSRNQSWYALWTQSNPASPLNVHKDGSSIGVQVESVSFFTRSAGGKDLAQIRYVKSLRMPGSVDETPSHWIATVQYAYTSVSKDPKLRRWNPLGFKVIDFRTEPEVYSEHLRPSGEVAGTLGGR